MRGQAGFFDVEERRDPATHALEPVYSVHYNDYAARLQGAQAAYDVGIQRTCWQIHSITNWIGDTGFLKAATSQYRSHVYLSDVTRLGGRVEAKEVDADGDHVVRLTTWAHNQRGRNVMPGTAVIALPHRPALAGRMVDAGGSSGQTEVDADHKAGLARSAMDQQHGSPPKSLLLIRSPDQGRAVRRVAV